MTGELFREETYLRDAPARVAAHTPEGGVILDNSLFYPTGGGQPGDSGWLTWDNRNSPSPPPCATVTVAVSRWFRPSRVPCRPSGPM